MEEDKVRDIEKKIADLKARWPAHSVPPSMWQELEELEDELEDAKKERSSRVKQYLREKRFRFREVNVERDADGAGEIERFAAARITTRR